MTGERQMLKGALLAGAAGVPLAAALGGIFRGGDGALSAGIAAALPAANLAVASLLQGLVARKWPMYAFMVSMPSLVFRMLGMLAAFAVLQTRPFIDGHAFAVAFAASIVTVLAAECWMYARTPFLALEMGERV